jgi:hypothetical protein
MFLSFLLFLGSALQELSLRDAFFNIAPLTTLGVDPIIKYLATDRSQEVDTVRATSASHTRTHHHHHAPLQSQKQGFRPLSAHSLHAVCGGAFGPPRLSWTTCGTSCLVPLVREAWTWPP